MKCGTKIIGRLKHKTIAKLKKFIAKFLLNYSLESGWQSKQMFHDIFTFKLRPRDFAKQMTARKMM